MDEISQRKGYRDFITMVANAETGNLLEVIDSHKQDEIIEALRQQPLEVREQVEEVSVDMYVNICSQNSQPSQATPQTEQTPTQQHIDLGDAPEIFSFFDRTPQLTTLETWILQQNTRLIAILGISGIGKTTLSLQLIEQIKHNFNYIIYRSLRFSPTLETTLTNLLQIFAPKTETPQNIETQLSQLINYLRQHRC